MLKKPSILACLGIYCSIFRDFVLFAGGYVCFSSFAEGLTGNGSGKHFPSDLAARLLSVRRCPLMAYAAELACCYSQRHD
jgi:hypothetical protein